MSKALKSYAKQAGYTHAEVTGPNTLLLYAIEECEVCGCEIAAANSVTVHSKFKHDAVRAGLTVMESPSEGGYSDIHEGSTCDACCYDANAAERHADFVRNDVTARA